MLYHKPFSLGAAGNTQPVAYQRETSWKSILLADNG